MPPSTTLPVVDLTGLDGDAATRAALLDGCAGSRTRSASST